MRNCLGHGFDGPLLGEAHEVLELREDLFDGIEIGAVGREEEEPGTGFADGGPDGHSLVAAEIVHDDDIAGPEAGNKHLLDIEQEALAIDGPSKTQGAVTWSQRRAARNVMVFQ